MGEDIVFDPVDTSQAHPELYGHPTNSMDFFAALMVECDNVVIPKRVYLLPVRLHDAA